jgi:F-type H+-transporting ATPase subunit delta
MLLGPTLGADQKKNIIKEIAKEIADPIFLNFCFLLIDRGRLKYLDSITNAYRHLVNEKLGLIEAELVTAQPLEDAFIEGIRKKLETAYQKKVALSTIITPEILGGMIIKIGNKRLDESVLERLSKLKKTLLAAKV